MLVSRGLIRPARHDEPTVPVVLLLRAGDAGETHFVRGEATNRQSSQNPDGIQNRRLHTYFGRFNPEHRTRRGDADEGRGASNRIELRWIAGAPRPIARFTQVVRGAGLSLD